MQDAMTTEDTTYNGWAGGYCTWVVALWLSNDEVTSLETLARVRAIVNEKEPTSEYWTLEQSHRYNTADEIKGYVMDELAPDLGATFAADLLGYALELVDWNEIAAAWIEQASE